MTKAPETPPSGPQTIQEWAAYYISKGLQVVPLTPNSKICRDAGWMQLIFKPEDFEDDDNLGIRSVNGLVVIDEDCAEAVACADAFFPPTGAVYGRHSKPRSKRLYYSPFPKTVAFKDFETGTTLLEIRSAHQDLAPPSRHPDGELLTWDGEVGTPISVEHAPMLRAGRLNATCALVMRYYAPPGARHEWCLALAGTLRALGVEQDECVTILKQGAAWANDNKLNDRLVEVHSTYERPDDSAITGTKTLLELAGKTLITSFQKIWGSASGAFILDAKGERILANSQENIKRALKKLNVELWFDEFAQKSMMKYEAYSGPLTDQLLNRIRLEIETRYHFLSQKDHFYDVVQDICHLNPHHPVHEYLQKLVWDGVPRVDTWIIKAARAVDTAYVRAVSALVLIAAVRRVMKPGCKFDEMLVLESGKQGLLKSTALRTLCPHDEWFSDDLPLNVEAKEIVERTLGKWIIEASDLSGMRPASVEHLKGMLSRQVDGPVRMAYGRLAVEQRRQFVIIGTTNSHTYLTDSTGNRRFWPVRVERFDTEYIRLQRDQIWAEAFQREQKGESIRLDPKLYAHAEFQQARRRTNDPWEEELQRHFEGDYYRLTPREIWGALGIPVERQDVAAQKRVFGAMQYLGFRRMTITDGEKVVKGWGKGSKLVGDRRDPEEDD